jgi:hypothetical protein
MPTQNRGHGTLAIRLILDAGVIREGNWLWFVVARITDETRSLKHSSSDFGRG